MDRNVWSKEGLFLLAFLCSFQAFPTQVRLRDTNECFLFIINNFFLFFFPHECFLRWVKSSTTWPMQSTRVTWGALNKYQCLKLIPKDLIGLGYCLDAEILKKFFRLFLNV